MLDRTAHEQRTAWYRQARFGMFIHWGLYAIPARGEWVRSTERMPEADYLPYFREFSAPDFNPRAWAAMARKAGMKYAVLTAKHHDGFCLFDSRHTDFKSTNTPFGRDAVREFVDAFRAEGLKVGLYYSLLDWHHPDYPHYGDANHPMRDDPSQDNAGRDFNRYLDYMHAQVRELCENYGQIDLFWFDFSYDHLRGEAWRATDLVRMVRALQPQALLDNRLEVSGRGFGSLVTDQPSDFCGDFVSPEQIIPPQGIRDAQGREVLWESCVTMNNHWGYCGRDRYFKPAGMLIRKLVECVSKGGNMLINVGPNAKGDIPKHSVKILQEIGEWMYGNSDSIYGCGKSMMEKPEWGRYTQKGNMLYAHIYDRRVGSFRLDGLEGKLKKARHLEDGAELELLRPWNGVSYPEDAFVNLGVAQLFDERDTVLELELK